MADVSTITANGTTYNIKDETARAAQTNKILTITVGSFSSFPKTVSNEKISGDMVMLSCVFSNRSAILSDVTWQTSAGQLKLTGTMDGSTTAVITLGRTEY